MCIVLLVVVVVYVVAGGVFQWKVKHASGLDLIPNRAFWSALPGYIKDGFVFCYAKIRGKQYTSLP